MCSDEESDIKSTDAPEIRERKEANVRTRTTMANLRQRMEQTKLNKVSISVKNISTSIHSAWCQKYIDVLCQKYILCMA